MRYKKSNEVIGGKREKKNPLFISRSTCFCSFSIKEDDYLCRRSHDRLAYYIFVISSRLASDRYYSWENFSLRRERQFHLSVSAQTLESKKQNLVREVDKFVTESRRGSGERRPRGIHTRSVRNYLMPFQLQILRDSWERIYNGIVRELYNIEN